MPKTPGTCLSSSGSSPSFFSHVIVGKSEGSCFTLHSKSTFPFLWTTLYSGCFRIRVGSGKRRVWKTQVISLLCNCYIME